MGMVLQLQLRHVLLKGLLLRVLLLEIFLLLFMITTLLHHIGNLLL
jgi:hypothetical protein